MGALTPRPPQSPEPNRPGGESGGLTRFAGAPDLSDQFKPTSDMFAVGADMVGSSLRSALSSVTPGGLVLATTGDPVVRRRKNGSVYQATTALSVTRSGLFFGELRRALASQGSRMRPDGPWRADGAVVDLTASELRSAKLASRPVARAASAGQDAGLSGDWRSTLRTTLALLPEDVERRVDAFLGDAIVWAHQEMLRSSQPVQRSTLRHGTYTAAVLTERVALVVATADKLVAVSAERVAERGRDSGSDDVVLARGQWDVRLLCARRGERREIVAKTDEPGAVGSAARLQIGEGSSRL